MASDLRGLELDPDSMNSESMAAGDTNAKDESTESVADGDANSKDTKSKKTKPEETFRSFFRWNLAAGIAEIYPEQISLSG